MLYYATVMVVTKELLTSSLQVIYVHIYTSLFSGHDLTPVDSSRVGILSMWHNGSGGEYSINNCGLIDRMSFWTPSIISLPRSVLKAKLVV